MPGRRKSPLKIANITSDMCAPESRLRLLAQVPFFSGLKAAELNEISQLFHDKGFEAEEIIYFEADPASQFYVIAAGKVKLTRHTQTGREVMLDLLNPGEYFGSLSPLPEEAYSETAQAHTSVCTLNMGKDVFRSILSTRPEMALKVLEITTQRLVSAQEMVRQLSAHSVEQRLAYILLKFGDKFGQKQGKGLLIQVPISREELAKLTGTTTESASRTLSQFQKDGLIQAGRQWVSITSLEGLKAILQEV